jgi:hypothetical protein
MVNDKDQKTHLKGMYKKLSQDGFELTEDKISEFDTIVATKKQFELSWFATQLNIFVIMGVSNDISRDVIKDFSKISLDYAIKHNRGLPRGLQAGVVSFAFLVSSIIGEDAKRWVQQRPQKHFAAFEMPVIFDLKNDRLYYYDKTPIWGGLYYKFFRNIIEKYFK